MYAYIFIHWFVHFTITHLITYFTKFSIIDYSIKIWIFDYLIFDYLIMYVATILIDLDHLIVLKKTNISALIKLSKVRVPFPFHNFFFLSILSLTSLFLVLCSLKNFGIILLAPISNLLYDFVEDLIIFKTGYKKWKRRWGVDINTLEKLLKKKIKHS
ncbi:MAG: hypothetical protein RMJ17_02960 [Candidatus Aenigmarchaeota archaeon]|nr:hypothetical protein [Candidatus Aenigmarchaeota archaeon]MDW8149527.1 hypothetical protein [Candidatus Aenigmarchaeota archaeon]